MKFKTVHSHTGLSCIRIEIFSWPWIKLWNVSFTLCGLLSLNASKRFIGGLVSDNATFVCMCGFDNLVFLRGGLASALLGLSPGLWFPHSCPCSARKTHLKFLLFQKSRFVARTVYK